MIYIEMTKLYDNAAGLAVVLKIYSAADIVNDVMRSIQQISGLRVQTMGVAAFAFVTTAGMTQTSMPLAIKPDHRVILMQITLSNDGGAFDAAYTLKANVFREKMKSITSCDNAFDIALPISAEITLKNDVKFEDLPSGIQTSLLARPIGTAMPAFRVGNVARTLIQCPDTFRFPERYLPTERPVPLPKTPTLPQPTS